MMHHRTSLPALCALLASLAFAAAQEPPPEPLAREPMVDIRTFDPTIVVELRYATNRNVTGRPIYPPEMQCLVRQSVAERLRYAQHLLRKKGYGLKIWDAHRPAWAQQILWDFVQDPEFVADPAKGGSLHTWGVAVDATLVDKHGREQKMPTDFDDFSPAAAMRYKGRDSRVAKNLNILQAAMASAGFLGMRDEWWHFIARGSRQYAPEARGRTQLQAAHVFVPGEAQP